MEARGFPGSGVDAAHGEARHSSWQWVNAVTVSAPPSGSRERLGEKTTCCLNALLFREQLYDNGNDIAQDSEDPVFSSLSYFT